jgi:hypothetical protein
MTEKQHSSLGKQCFAGAISSGEKNTVHMAKNDGTN